MEDNASATPRRPFRIGFRTSIITPFIAVVLLLTLVYLSFERVSLIRFSGTDRRRQGYHCWLGWGCEVK